MINHEARILALVPELKGLSYSTTSIRDVVEGFEKALKSVGENPKDKKWGQTVLVAFSGIFLYKDPVKGPVIQCSPEIGEIMTDEQLRGVILHEVAHVLNKDLEGEPGQGVLVDLEKELAADAYAVEQGTDPLVLVSAIKAATTLGVKGLFSYHGRVATQEKIDSLWTADQETIARFEALTK